MRHRFIKRINCEEEVPIKYLVLKDSIAGIKRLLERYKRDAYRSNVPDYVIRKEEKMDKLKLILVDLKRLL